MSIDATLPTNIRNFLDESSQIEGYDVTKSFLDREELLVRSNGDKAYRLIMGRCAASKGILTEQDLLDTHAALMGQLLPKLDCGAYRTGLVSVGSHIPPKAEFIPGIMMAYIEQFNDRAYETYDAHCRFETIHPFRDGNGRIGRLLWAYDLTRRGQQIHNMLDLFTGANFNEKRLAYYASLDSFRAK